MKQNILGERIKAAIHNQRSKGIDIDRRNLSLKIYGIKSSSYLSMTNLINGRINRISIKHIDKLCSELDVTPNYLFGYDD